VAFNGSFSSLSAFLFKFVRFTPKFWVSTASKCYDVARFLRDEFGLLAQAFIGVLQRRSLVKDSLMFTFSLQYLVSNLVSIDFRTPLSASTCALTTNSNISES
jgi:hypothetical protein